MLGYGPVLPMARHGYHSVGTAPLAELQLPTGHRGTLEGSRRIINETVGEGVVCKVDFVLGKGPPLLRPQLENYVVPVGPNRPRVDPKPSRYRRRPLSFSEGEENLPLPRAEERVWEEWGGRGWWSPRRCDHG